MTPAPPRDRRGQCFDAFGYGFEFVARSVVARRLVGRLYNAFAATREPSRADVYEVEERYVAGKRRWALHLGLSRLLRASSLGAALRAMEVEVCRRVIDGRPDLVALHGAWVVGSRGAALIMGPSGAGKSTLALALAGHGYAVGSDDVALFNPTSGNVRPLPRCFHFDARTRRLLRYTDLRSRLPASAIEHGFITPRDVCREEGFSRLSSILFLSSTRSRSPILSPATHAEMAVLVLSQSAWGARQAGQMGTVLAQLMSGVTSYRLTAGRLRHTAEAVGALLGAPIQDRSTPTVAGASAETNGELR